jgi:hypothetical protein
VLSQQLDGRQRLEGGHVARAGHHHVGLPAAIIAGPLPDADPGLAVHNRRVHVQELGLRLFPGDDHVDEVARAQAPVRNTQKRVGVGGQEDADGVGLLVDHVIDEARVLVAEAVVVLTPDVGGEQVVE